MNKMSFLNKYQYHYHSKHLENFFTSKNYSEIFAYLEKISDNKKVFHDLSLKFVNQAINQSSQDISKNKIVWINSFLPDDNKYVSSFIENYLLSFNSLKQSINSYQNEISDILIKSEKIDFNTLVNQSYFFQWMIINRQKLSFKFINNNLPFFSTDDKYNFTKPVNRRNFEEGFSNWSVAIPAQTLNGKKIGGGKTPIVVKARSAREAIQKAAKRLGVDFKFLKTGKVTKE